MIFRTKFEKSNWFMIGFAALNIALELHDRHDSAAFKAFIVSSWSLWVLLPTWTWLFDRLELNAGRLRQREGFRTKKVPLAEVTLVRNYGTTTSKLVIEYNPPMPAMDPKSIVVNPKDRSGFLSAMRQFAPQAAFEV
jgi:hypothetical protein